MVISGVLSASMSFTNDIHIYYREHDSFVYRSDTYYLSKIIVEVNKSKINK